MLGVLNDVRARQVRIMLEQDESNFRMIIEGETESENRAKQAAAMFNLVAKMIASKEGSDEAFFASKTRISNAGKSFIINFSISREEKNQMLEKNLKRLREKQKNS